MIEVVLFRHPETEDCVEGVIKGHRNSLLTYEGLIQADQQAQSMEGIHFDRLLTSDLIRCQMGAYKHSAVSGVDCETTSGWRERDYGEHSGQQSSSVGYRNDYQGMIDHHIECECPQGETPQEFRRRVREGIESLYNGARDRIALHTHGGVIMTALDILIPNQEPVKHAHAQMSYVKIEKQRHEFRAVESVLAFGADTVPDILR